MNAYEKLEDMAAENDVEIMPHHFESDRIKGLYCDQVIALSNTLRTYPEKTCVLAEELGHYHTSSGDIIDTSNMQNQKQEMRARMWAYDRQVGLIGIVESFRAGCRTLSEMAEYLEVTEEFLGDALERYRQKYGIYTTIGHYIIYFEPRLVVAELLSDDIE